MIVIGHNGFTLVVHVSSSFCPSVIHLSIFSFLEGKFLQFLTELSSSDMSDFSFHDNSLSKCQ